MATIAKVDLRTALKDAIRSYEAACVEREQLYHDIEVLERHADVEALRSKARDGQLIAMVDRIQESAQTLLREIGHAHQTDVPWDLVSVEELNGSDPASMFEAFIAVVLCREYTNNVLDNQTIG